MAEELSRQTISVPVPDPTTLTQDALRREVAGLKELLETRLNAMDKAVEIFSDNLNRVPSETDLKVGQLREVVYETFKTTETEVDGIRLLLNEKFHGVEIQFTERDVRTRDTAAQNALALTAALAAQKEAVAEQNKSFEKSIDKSERSTSEQIMQQSILLTSTGNSLNDKIAALDSRMTRFEGLGLGVANSEVKQHASSSMALVIVGVVMSALIGMAGLTLGVITLIIKLSGH